MLNILVWQQFKFASQFNDIIIHIIYLSYIILQKHSFYSIQSKFKSVYQLRYIHSTIFCPEISSIHYLLNYSIFVNISVFKRCSIKSFWHFFRISPLKRPLQLIRIQEKAFKYDVYWDFVLQLTRIMTLKIVRGIPSELRMEIKMSTFPYKNSL